MSNHDYNGKKCFLTGEGKTKQAAKKQAARMVFEKVRHLSLEEKAAYNHNAHLTPSKFLFNGNQFTNNTLKNDEKIISSEVVNYTERLKNKLNSSTNPTINLLKVNHNFFVLKFNVTKQYTISSMCQHVFNDY